MGFLKYFAVPYYSSRDGFVSDVGLLDLLPALIDGRRILRLQEDSPGAVPQLHVHPRGEDWFRPRSCRR